MRNNSKDRTIERNLAQKWRFLIGEFELVKAGRHPQFRFREDFYRFHGTNRQTFYKYYHRFQQEGNRWVSLAPEAGTQVEDAPDAALHRGKGTGATAQGYQSVRDLCHTAASPPGAYPSALHHLCHQPSAQPEPVEQENGTVQATDYQDPGRGTGPSGQPPPEPGPDCGYEAALLPGGGAGRLHSAGLGRGNRRHQEP